MIALAVQTSVYLANNASSRASAVRFFRALLDIFI